MNLLSELCNGEFKQTEFESNEKLSLTTYKTKSGRCVQVARNIHGKWIYVNGIRQDPFMSWRIKRALRKGSLK
jgi:hypothetical protein